jgi:hypothetical protein
MVPCGSGLLEDNAVKSKVNSGSVASGSGPSDRRFGMLLRTSFQSKFSSQQEVAGPLKKPLVTSQTAELWLACLSLAAATRLDFCPRLLADPSVRELGTFNFLVIAARHRGLSAH